jgi:ATP-binding cassette subfamily B protein
VRRLDRILVFDDGRVAEQGDHASLMARPDGLYRRLVERQTDGPGMPGARHSSGALPEAAAQVRHRPHLNTPQDLASLRFANAPLEWRAPGDKRDNV